MNTDTGAFYLVSDFKGNLWFQGSQSFANSNYSCKDVEKVFLSQHWAWEIQELQKENKLLRSLKVSEQDMKSDTLGTYSSSLANISYCLSLSDLPNKQQSSIKKIITFPSC